MTNLEKLMRMNHVKSAVKPAPTIVEISRFEFDLLEMTYNDTTYRILEDDGSITTVKGEY